MELSVAPEAALSPFAPPPDGVPPECSAVSGSTLVRATRGRVVFGCITLGRASPGMLLRFTARGLAATSAAFVVRPGVPSRLHVFQAARLRVTAGELLRPAPRVAVTDKCGNFITDAALQADVSAARARGGGELAGETARRTADGVAEFALLFVQGVGAPDAPLYVEFSAPAPGGRDGVLRAEAGPIELAPGEAVALQVLEQPRATVQGSAIRASVRLTDHFGNTVRGDNRSVVISFAQGSGCARPAERGDECAGVCDGTLAADGTCVAFDKDALAFDAAAARCAAWGGTLAAIAELETNVELAPLAGDGEAWIGLRYDARRGQFLWDAPGVPLIDLKATGQDVFTSWGADSPDQSGARACVALGADGGWVSRPCDLALPSICARAVGGPPSPQTMERCSCCQRLLGSETVHAGGGVAVFDGVLSFAEPNDEYRLAFSAQSAAGAFGDARALIALSQTFRILPRAARLVMAAQPGDAAAAQPLVEQPAIGLLGADGTAVTGEAVGLTVSIADAAPGVVLTGTRNATSLGGVARFTDLQLTLPPGLPSSAVTLAFAAEVGPPELRSTLRVLSRPALVLRAAAALAVTKQPAAVNPAGEPLGDIAVQMLDATGARVDKSNTLVHVAALDHGAPGAGVPRAIRGTVTALCVGGVVRFEGLRLEVASANYTLVFSAPHVGLHVASHFFVVQADAYAGVTITDAPTAAEAGTRLGTIRVVLSDRFGNPITVEKPAEVVVRAEKVGGGGCCTQEHVLATTRGVAQLRGAAAFTLTAAGEFRLSARLRFDMQECVDGQELFGRSAASRLAICNSRLNALFVAAPLHVQPGGPASIEALVSVLPVAIAGAPFPRQPVCEVRDAFGNRVAQEYAVSVSARDAAGRGCVCVPAGPGQMCAAASSSRPVQRCAAPGGCAAERLEEVATPPPPPLVLSGHVASLTPY